MRLQFVWIACVWPRASIRLKKRALIRSSVNEFSCLRVVRPRVSSLRDVFQLNSVNIRAVCVWRELAVPERCALLQQYRLTQRKKKKKMQANLIKTKERKVSSTIHAFNLNANKQDVDFFFCFLVFSCTSISRSSTHRSGLGFDTFVEDVFVILHLPRWNTIRTL